MRSGTRIRGIAPPLIAATVLAGLLVVGMAVAGIVIGTAGARGPGGGSAPGAASGATPETGPVALVPVDAPQAGSAGCRTLLADLPASLDNAGGALRRRPLASPAPAGAMAWGGTATSDPVVLRCGIDRPAELSPTSELLAVDGVDWLQVSGPDSATWYAVNRPVYVALTLPGGLSTGPLQEISAAIGRALPPAG